MTTKIPFESRYMTLGIIGALIILYGHFQNIPQPFYIMGSTALLLTAIHYKLLYFIALEIILVAGHTAILLEMSRCTQIGLPVLLCFQLLIFYIMLGKENSIILLIGIIGIALLSLGLSYNNQWIFFSGSSFIATYSYHNGYKGCTPAFIWGLLNTVFALLALSQLSSVDNPTIVAKIGKCSARLFL